MPARPTTAAAEAARLDAVHNLRLVDTAPEERFDKVVRMAQALFDVSMVEINLIDQDRQYTKAAHPSSNAGKNTPRDISFCNLTVTEDRTLLVPDATGDPRFSRNPLVTGDPHIRFYAGHPLTSQGQRVGSLCLVDDEPRTLTGTQQLMLADLASWVEHELERNAEMAYAAEVQRRLLPKSIPTIDGYDIAGTCVAARDIGGDFYDWHQADDRLHLVLVDVMGKGVGPALIAAGLRSTLRATFTGAGLANDFNRAAAAAEEDLTDASSFATVFCAQVTPSTGNVTYLDAGHGLGLIVAADGSYRRLPSDALPLGVVAGDQWATRDTQLNTGETLLAVSDGILDVFDTQSQALERVAGAVASSCTARQAVEAVTDLAEDSSHAQDDLTVVALRRA
jgi:hypothetical protein